MLRVLRHLPSQILFVIWDGIGASELGAYVYLEPVKFSHLFDMIGLKRLYFEICFEVAIEGGGRA